MGKRGQPPHEKSFSKRLRKSFFILKKIISKDYIIKNTTILYDSTKIGLIFTEDDVYRLSFGRKSEFFNEKHK